MLVYDGIVDTVGRMSNGAFFRKATPNRFEGILGLIPYVLFGFQENPAVGLTVTNEGYSGAPGDMTLSAAMWTGAGWYQHFGRVLQAGNRGFGLVGVGGASTNRGTIPSHAGILATGQQKYTWIYKFRMNGTGGGGGGRLSEASASHICFASGANTIAMSIYDGAAWASNSTGANVVYGYWHDLVIVFDGTQAGDVARLRMYLDGRDVTVNVAPGIPAAMVDGGVPTILLNGFLGGVWSRAWDGDLGLFAAIPGEALTIAQAQEVIEIMALFQPTVYAVNQPSIIVPGHYGAPEYDFDGAANPNSDYIGTYQSVPLKTTQGSLLVWFSNDDLTNAAMLVDMGDPGATDDRYSFYIRGDQVGDPIETQLIVGGALQIQLRGPGNNVNPNNNFVAWTSDGATIRAYFGGNALALALLAGANTGQWWSSANGAIFLALAVRVRPVLANVYNGKQSKILIYDRALAQIEIQQIQARGFGPNGPRWYPRM